MSSSRAAKKSKHPRVQAAPAAASLNVTPLDAASSNAASSNAASSNAAPLDVMPQAEGARPIEESLTSEASGVVERPVVEGGGLVEAASVEATLVEVVVEAKPVETAEVVEAAPAEATSVEAALVEAAPVETTDVVEAAPVEATVEVVALEVAALEAAPVEAVSPENVVANPDEEFVPSPVNYDEPGLFEVDVDEELYRFDAGKQGTAICLSKRLPNTWRWNFLGELRWDGRDLRSRALERQLLQKLSVELRTFAAESAE